MTRFGRILGIAVQALILGSLLYLAIFRLAGAVGGARVFQYQGF